MAVIPAKAGINSGRTRQVTILVLKTALLKLNNSNFQLFLTLIPLFRGMTDMKVKKFKKNRIFKK
ncbi:MAG: hypothetical protein V4642_12140 [Bacteroidota bacterium]